MPHTVSALRESLAAREGWRYNDIYICEAACLHIKHQVRRLETRLYLPIYETLHTISRFVRGQS